MNREDLVSSIGTIARSGSKEFLKELQKSKDGANAAAPELIGRFGVGFYSSFMVADRVTILSRRAGDEKGWSWESTGDGAYTIEESARDEAGVTITLHLKKTDPSSGSASDDEGDGDAGADPGADPGADHDQDFTEEWVIRQTIRKHSDFINYPITMMISREEASKDADGKPVDSADRVKVLREETLNSMKAIWTRPAKEVKPEEYAEFYKHLSHDWESPLKTIHFSAEGLMEYQALLFIPSRAPFDLFNPQRKHGIHLYVRRVFIMDDCRELIPDYLRFVRGIVDSSDLPLNISRQTIQHDRQIRQIRNRLIGKTLDTLKEMMEKDREEYEKFWKAFGIVLKEGMVHDEENRNRIRDMVLFQTTLEKEKLCSFGDYIARMQPEQKNIYYLTGESRSALENSPHLEALRARNIEVIFFTDPVDEFAITRIDDVDGKPLKPAAKGMLEFDETDSEKKAHEAKKEELGSLTEYLSDRLKEDVSAVRLSPRLKTSAACLVTEESGMAAHIEKMMRQAGQALPTQKRVLEINPEHPLIARMRSMFDEDRSSARLADYAYLLHGQAALAEGIALADPPRFAKLVAEIMAG